MLPSEEAIFTEIALQNKFVTLEQIEECQKVQQTRERPVPLGMILIEKGYINDRKLNLITEIRLNQKLNESYDQDVAVFTCEKCQLLETITHYEVEEVYYCKGCGTPLNTGNAGEDPEYVELGEVSSSIINQNIYGYQVLEHIGEGGMADVYKALHLKSKEIVAIKILKNLASPERFIREIQHLSIIEDPNVIKIMYRGKYEDRYFYIMEYLEGSNLLERLNQSRIPLETTLNILKQIASGLRAVHAKGIWHRDIKPSNIMICGQNDQDLVVKIMDFGVARGIGDSDFTAPGQLVGTFKYMSPEQIRGQDLEERADIFSLGILAYEMLAHQEPFKVKESLGYLHANILLEAPPLCEMNPEVPVKLGEIVHKMIAKDKSKRYSTKELCRELERFEQYFFKNLPIVEIEDTASVFYTSPHPNRNTSVSLDFTLLKASQENSDEFYFDHFETQDPEATMSLDAPITEAAEMTPLLEEELSPESIEHPQEPIKEEDTSTQQHVYPQTITQPQIPRISPEENFWKDLERLFRELKTAKTDEAFKTRIQLLEQHRKEELAKSFLEPIDKELTKAHLRWGSLHQNELSSDKAKQIYLRALCLYHSEYNEQILNKLRDMDRTLHQMEYIPPGFYAVNEDKTQIRIVSGFFLDKYPVTNQKYRQFLRVTQRKAPPHWEENGIYPPATELHPVTYVTYDEVLAFAQWQGKTLPSEEEWEYAAKGPTSRKWSYGKTFSPEICNTRESGVAGTTKVDRYPEGASFFKILDMTGNVWEWTRSTYGFDEMKTKGGSYLTYDEFCTIEQFNYFPKSKKLAHLGFRCCKNYSLSQDSVL